MKHLNFKHWSLASASRGVTLPCLDSFSFLFLLLFFFSFHSVIECHFSHGSYYIFILVVVIVVVVCILFSRAAAAIYILPSSEKRILVFLFFYAKRHHRYQNFFWWVDVVYFFVPRNQNEQRDLFYMFHLRTKRNADYRTRVARCIICSPFRFTKFFSFFFHLSFFFSFLLLFNVSKMQKRKWIETKPAAMATRDFVVVSCIGDEVEYRSIDRTQKKKKNIKEKQKWNKALITFGTGQDDRFLDVNKIKKNYYYSTE